jgi:5-(carboxyamino)imidazole ribonucleotide synthase
VIGAGGGPLRVGVLGGGQLGRMLGLAGLPLGLRFRFLDPGGDGAPAAAVGQVVEGGYGDRKALEALARGVDVVTWEFENVPVESARWLAERVPVHPPPEALEAAQDRWVEKETFARLGIPVAPTRPVGSLAELEEAAARVGLPAVLKTRRFGYDGKGQVVIRTEAELAGAWETLGGRPLVLEGFVDFRRELSLLVARSTSGETRAWPLVENGHREGILRTSVVPAAGGGDTETREAEAHGGALLDALGYVGVLAVEFFQTPAGLVANEMAPRVHNSGHWTQNGARTSQFENHLRAILGLPLGPTELVHPGGGAGMVNFIGGIPPREVVLAEGEAPASVTGALHLYDKVPRPGRKVGHLNLHGPNREEVFDALRRAEALAGGAGDA